MLRSFLALAAGMACATVALAQNAYIPTVLIASDASYNPTVMVDPLLLNAWGIALRPPGAGGHIWISNFASGTTTTYIGDAHGLPLSQDSLASVAIGTGSGIRVDGRPVADPPMPTGQVYNYSTTDFVVSGEGISAASKFIFVTAEGTISGWTEVPDPLPNDPNHKRRQTVSVVMVDQSQHYDDDRLRFTGCAITDFATDNHLYVTNYITNEVEVYDREFHRLPIPANRFAVPNQPDGYHVWNIQYLHTGPNGEGRLWVAYALGGDPWEQEATFGDVAEFDLDGNFIKRLSQAFDTDPFADGELRVPWGFAIAPANFGTLSNALLIANFGDGTIAAYNYQTGAFIDFIRDSQGSPISIDGIWGIVFGNGVSLGDSNALYYTAGPNNEQDGVFGSIRLLGSTCPTISQQPVAVSTTPCGSASMTVGTLVPGAIAPSYRWQAEFAPGVWTDLGNGPLIRGGRVLCTLAGTDSPSLNISSLATLGWASPALNFRCDASNSCGSTPSDSATLTICAADFNCSGATTVPDIFDFLSAWFAADPRTDINGASGISVQDIFDYLARWFAGC